MAAADAPGAGVEDQLAGADAALALGDVNVALGRALEAVRSQVEEIIGQGQQAPSGHIPFTPRAKKVLELSLREALQLGELLRSEGREPVYYLVGRKAVGYFQFRRMSAAGEWTGDTDTPHFNTAEQIAGALLDAYDRGGEEQGGVDEIHLVYNRFVSMMTQEPETVRLLPLEVVEADEVEAATSAPNAVYPLYEFEPSPEVVLDALLPVYVQSRVFNALLQSSAHRLGVPTADIWAYVRRTGELPL